MKHKSVKESGEMSILEARIIQYGKLILGLIGIILLAYFLFNK